MMSTFKLAAFLTSGAVLSNGSDPWGCCYNVGFGANMKECCQEPTQGGDVFLSSCRLQSRPGGATWFVNYQTCAWMEYNVWNPPTGVDKTKLEFRRSWLKIDKPAVTLSLAASDNSYDNPQGCCFNVGFGDGMKECCQAPTQGGDVRKSDCNLQQRMGGATWFVENETCAWMESNVWGRGYLTTSANVRLDKPSGDSNLLVAAKSPEEEDVPVYDPQGCCFNVGFGAGMKECCQKPVQGGNVRRSDCDVEHWPNSGTLTTSGARRGEATWFVENRTCEWLEKYVWSSNIPSRKFLATGCCYSFRVALTIAPGKVVNLHPTNVALRSRGEPCCFTPLLGNQSIETDCKALRAGDSRFVEHIPCHTMEALGPAFWGH